LTWCEEAVDPRGHDTGPEQREKTVGGLYVRPSLGAGISRASANQSELLRMKNHYTDFITAVVSKLCTPYGVNTSGENNI
jgi:hypothetical protein